MENTWFDRLIEAIKADGRDMRTISLAAKCGPNYVQQMIKDNKHPGIDRFIRIVNVLGASKAFHILTGKALSDADLEFLATASQLDEDTKKQAVSLFRTILEKQESQAQSLDSED